MNRGAGRKKIFHNDEQRSFFITLLEKSVEQFQIEVHAYCLMDNHYHLLVRTPENSLSDAMKFIGSHYARRFNVDIRTDGSLFRGRFKAIVLDADDYLVQVSRYIHRNPVEARIVEAAAEYHWSSYAAYKDPVLRPTWLMTKEVLRRVGVALPDRHDAYLRFVENDRLQSMREFYNARRIPGILGSKEFRHYVAGFGFADAAHDVAEGEIELERIEEVVARLNECGLQAIRDRSRGRENISRTVVMYLAEKWCAKSKDQLALHFDVKSTTLSVRLCQLRNRLKCEPNSEFARAVRNAEAALGLDSN